MKLSKTIKQAFALLFVLLMIASMIPACFAEQSMDDVMANFEKGVQKPKQASLLDEPKEMYVMTVHGNYLYVNKKPAESKFGKIEEGKIVTVYAVQGSYSLVKDNESGKGGWVITDLLSDTYYPGPNPADTAGLQGNIQRPGRKDYIEDYVTMYVKTSRGIRAQLWNIPNEKDDDYVEVGYAYEAEEVTIYAVRKEYSFVETSKGARGWIKTGLLVETYK